MKNLFTQIRYVLLASVALFAVSCAKEKAPKPGKDFEVKVKKDKNPTPVQTSWTVVVLGSSTAAGTGATPIDSGWVGLMKTDLANDGKTTVTYNLAEGGYTTYDILPTGSIVRSGRPAPDPLRNITTALSYKPDLVIINLPTNDIANGYTDAEIIANYKVVIAALNQASVQYIITGTQPRDFTDPVDSRRLKPVNDLLISTFPGRVVDYLGKLSTSTWGILPQYALGDGIHLNNAGHKVVFQSVTSHPVYLNIFNY